LQERPSDIIRTLEKVSAVALGVFCAATDPLLFGTSFLAGVCIGVFGKNMRASGNLSSPCSGGFIEQITGIQAPPLVSLVSNFLMTYCHIDHHAQFVVPIIGVHLGISTGYFVKNHFYPPSLKDTHQVCLANC
jgi:hypothetical protein